MAKKQTTVILFRYDKSDAWTEYARTQVIKMVDYYKENAQRENPGAEVKTKTL